MNAAESKALADAFAEDEHQHKMRKAAAPGSPKPETLTTAIAKGLAAGFTIWQLLQVAAVGYATGGYAGAIAAVLALIMTPATP